MSSVGGEGLMMQPVCFSIPHFRWLLTYILTEEMLRDVSSRRFPCILHCGLHNGTFVVLLSRYGGDESAAGYAPFR